MTEKEFDCIVLGVGGFGSAACYWLSQSTGTRVLGLEQFEFCHDRGSSEDHSRIIRLSYNAPHYVELAKRAYATWDQVEKESGEQLILKTGGLDFAPRDSATGITPYVESLAECGVEHELVDADEIMRRWPQFRIDDSMHGLFQADSGIVIANRANATHRKLAQAQGATLKQGVAVRSIKCAGDEFEVITNDINYRAGSLILTAGAWTPQVLSWLGCTLPIEVTQEQVTYFAPRDPRQFQPGKFPVWIYLDDPAYYGFPLFADGVKAAQDAVGSRVTADTRSMDPDTDKEARLKTFLRKHIPDMVGDVIYSKTCLYTMSPDRDFILDAVPGNPNAYMAIGCGHGFKFASLIGETLAEMALGTLDTSEQGIDLRPYAADRPVLKQQNPERNYRL